MVLGALWLSWIGSILAIVFGHLALKQIARYEHAQGGRGLAIAGLVLGYLGAATLLVTILAVALD